jgi:hypothetical protein
MSAPGEWRNHLPKLVGGWMFKQKALLRDAAARVAFVVVVLFAALQAAPACAASLIGEWRGAYAYTDTNPPVPFSLALSQSGKVISGRSTELATFGQGPTRYLYATISGAADGQTVAFTKTYDGTGGQNHSVQYTGTLSEDGSVISGSWTLGAATGTWRVILNSGF